MRERKGERGKERERKLEGKRERGSCSQKIFFPRMKIFEVKLRKTVFFFVALNRLISTKGVYFQSWVHFCLLAPILSM